jgi:hypothetical protein
MLENCARSGILFMYCIRRERTKNLLKWVQESLDQTGDLSMITKLGRKGSKSSIALYNVHPADYDLIPKYLESAAWSFEKDGPILEKVMLKVHFKEDIRLTTTSQTPDGKGAEMISPGKAQRAYSRAKADNESSRHLGVDSTMNGDTAEMQRRILTAVGRRMEDMRLHNIRGQPLRYAVKVLLCTLVSYAPLLSGLTLKQMKAIDAAVLAKIRRRCGLTTSDADEHLFISRGCNGLGFSTFTGNHITSVARELEVTLNSKQTQAMVARARLHSASHGRLWLAVLVVQKLPTPIFISLLAMESVCLIVLWNKQIIPWNKDCLWQQRLSLAYRGDLS